MNQENKHREVHLAEDTDSAKTIVQINLIQRKEAPIKD
jgi:hypothetical protein